MAIREALHGRRSGTLRRDSFSPSVGSSSSTDKLLNVSAEWRFASTTSDASSALESALAPERAGGGWPLLWSRQSAPKTVTEGERTIPGQRAVMMGSVQVLQLDGGFGLGYGGVIAAGRRKGWHFGERAKTGSTKITVAL